MKILKLIITEEELLWNWKDIPYRRKKEIYNMEWQLLFSFDPLDENLSDEIKDLFD